MGKKEQIETNKALCEFGYALNCIHYGMSKHDNPVCKDCLIHTQEGCSPVNFNQKKYIDNDNDIKLNKLAKYDSLTITFKDGTESHFKFGEWKSWEVKGKYAYVCGYDGEWIGWYSTDCIQSIEMY